MELTTGELKEGEVYFIGFGESTQLIARFKEDATTRCYFTSQIKIWLGKEIFSESNYCTHHAMTELRPATKEEIEKLEKYEAENDSYYMKKFVTTETADKYQKFFNFLNQEHGLVCTIEQMNEIVREALELDKKLRE